MPVQAPQEAVVARQVFRFLHRAGGSADAHYVTGKCLAQAAYHIRKEPAALAGISLLRYGCKKQWLLEFEGGNVFEADAGGVS